jgi:outer membrane usher protein
MNIIRSLKIIIMIGYIIFMMLLLMNDVFAKEDELYLKAFGKEKENVTQVLTVPLIINERDRGDIDIIFDGKKNDTRVNINKFLKFIEEILKDEVFIIIRNDFSDNEEIKISELKTHQLSANYDSNKLELHLHIPAEMRKTEVISFRPASSYLSSNDVIKPSDLSAYMNVYSDLQYVWKGSIRGRQPTNIVFDGALNYFDWVIEGEAFYREDNLNPFQRGNITLIKDLVPHSLRVAAMDVALPGVDFQSTVAAGGLMVTKNYQLRPDLITYPSSQKQFLLEHPSTVEVIVNSQLYRTFHLPAGSYDLRDFPVARGVNDIVIRIKDDFGRERELAFPFISETQLLAKDLHEYAYGFGFPSTISEGSYDTRQLFISGFHRIGLNDNMTAGLNFQGNKTQQLLGGELSFASKIGNVSIRNAISHDNEEGIAYAGSLNYSYQAPINSKHRDRVWDFSAVYKTQNFTTPNQAIETTPLAIDVTGEVSQPLHNNMFVSVRGNYQHSYSGNNNASNVSVLFRKNVSRQLSWDIAVTRADDFNSSVDYQVSANIRFSFGGNKQSVQSSYDRKDQSRRLSWDKRSEKTYDGFDISADAIKKNKETSLTGNIQHRNNRIEASLRHDMEWPRDKSQNQTKRTSLSLASALAYADGNFGVSRPIRDSFAIVVPHNSIAKQNIGVNPSVDSYQAESGLLGPAVISDLISYQPQTLSIDVPDLPLGYNLDNELPDLLPSFRSGTVIPLGGNANVLLVGTLSLRKGEIANLETGKLIALNDQDQEPRPFFTNRKGKFYIGKLKPGNYQLHLFSFPKDIITIEIPTDVAGIYDIGNIGIN